ncbi:MAG: hypothetical protein HXY36_06395 [Chloroflexi bacterium]|nr:hypothetical protein [Chloroflexota bacterium]NWF78200.1 hypothetical protein [Chloroflexota bacterium]
MKENSASDSVSKIAGLTLVNALVFQEVLADYESQVQHLRQTLQAHDAISAFADHWEYILTQINYYPIFHVARQLLLALPSNPDSEKALRSLAKTALEMVQQRAALRHDLMGRVYHRLLAEAKYLGTYYTSVPAATLLLKLALQPEKWNLDWSDFVELPSFRVADLACGTGTLLMAATEAITDNFLRACGAKRITPKMDVISRFLMEDIIYGYDVLLSALHLTASTLALRSPEVTFRLMHLWAMPFGGPHHRLGSIEFLKDFNVVVTTDLFGASISPDQISAKGPMKRQQATIPDLDLCVMNPPFTRSVGGNLLFGSLPDKERKPMQAELSKLLKRPRVHASATAGLGSVFVATGDLHLKAGGRMALVLPKALLSGVAWEQTRHLFRLRYQLEYIIASHDPERWNFSENTDLSEVLIIARKVDDPHAVAPPEGDVVCLNLWKNPTTVVEALSIAHSLNNAYPPDIATGQGAHEVMLGDVKFGEALTIPWGNIRDGLWILPCAFAQADLIRAAYQLSSGYIRFPGTGAVASLPLCALRMLAQLGPDRRDVYDAFRLTKTPTQYPAFWSHNTALVTTLDQRPNSYLSPLPKARRGRHLRRVQDLWPKAGRIVLAERLGLNTQRLVATRVSTKVLSNVWWPVSTEEEGEDVEKVLVLWLNSTLGLLILLSNREETHGPWVGFKKPVLSEMPVLDVRRLTHQQTQQLVDTYDALGNQALLPFPQMASDPVREAIDTAISDVLGLPDLSILRKLLAQEPVLCLRAIS